MSELIFEKYVFDPLKSNMYIAVENEQALIIDPCISNSAMKFLNSKKVKYITIILTHEHFDHVSGTSYFARFFETEIISHYKTRELVSNPKNHIASSYMASFMSKSDEIKQLVKKQCKNRVYFEVNTDFYENYNFSWNNHVIELVSTPGHSPGSICIICDNRYIFTGDSLIPNEDTNTRFRGGNKTEFLEITIPFLKGLDKGLTVLPGHGEKSTLGDIL